MPACLPGHSNGGALPVPRLNCLNAGAHEASERPISGLQTTNLIAAASYAEESREWFYYPLAAAGAQAAGAGGEEGRAGPVSKAEIRQLHRWVARVLRLGEIVSLSCLPDGGIHSALPASQLCTICPPGMQLWRR